MGTNIITSLKTAVPSSSNMKKGEKNISESKFDEVFSKRLQGRENNYPVKKQKSTYEKDGKLNKKNSIKEDTDKIDSTDKDNNIEKAAKDDSGAQNLINLLLALNNISEKTDNQLLSVNNIAEKVDSGEDILSVLKAVNGEEKSGLLKLLEEMESNTKSNQILEGMTAVKGEDSIDNMILSKLKVLLSGENEKDFKAELKGLIEQLEDRLSFTDDNKNTDQAMTKIFMKDTKLDSDGSNNESSKSAFREEKVLQSLLGEKEDGSNKAVSMAAYLNRFKQDVSSSTEPTNVPVVNRTTFNGDIIKAVKYMEVNSLRELTVNINPRELGSITIRITMEAGIMKANITAANKETLDLLNSNAVELRNSLNNVDIKVQEVSINIYNDDTTYFSGNFEGNSEGFNRNRQNHGGERRFNALEVEEANKEQKAAARDNNLSILA